MEFIEVIFQCMVVGAVFGVLAAPFMKRNKS